MNGTSTTNIPHPTGEPDLSDAARPPRQEDFRVDSFRYLEGRLHDLRTRVMRSAAHLAGAEDPESEVYVVKREHVDKAFRQCCQEILQQLVEIDSTAEPADSSQKNASGAEPSSTRREELD
jgi:hypothetical protein